MHDGGAGETSLDQPLKDAHSTAGVANSSDGVGGQSDSLRQQAGEHLRAAEHRKAKHLRPLGQAVIDDANDLVRPHGADRLDHGLAVPPAPVHDHPLIGRRSGSGCSP